MRSGSTRWTWILLVSMWVAPGPVSADGFELRLLLDGGVKPGINDGVYDATRFGGKLAFVRNEGFLFSYLIRADGVERTVASKGDLAPDDPFYDLEPFHFDGEDLVFVGLTTPGPRRFLYRDRGDGLEELFEAGDVLPGWPEPIEYMKDPWVEDGAITFAASQRILRFEDGTVEVVVEDAAEVPATGQVLDDAVKEFPMTHRGRTIFGASSSILHQMTGIYIADADGTLEPVVQAGDPSPAGATFPRFHQFGPGGLALYNRDAAFTVSGDPGVRGAYWLHEGELQRIAPSVEQIALGRRKMAIDRGVEGFDLWEEGSDPIRVLTPGELLNGLRVVEVIISRSALQGDRVVFAVGGFESFFPVMTHSQIWEVRFLADCEDGLDNDGDGLIDHPDDPGCRSERDNSERVGIGIDAIHPRWHPGFDTVYVTIFGSDELSVADVEAEGLVFGPAEAETLTDLSRPHVRRLSTFDADHDGHDDLTLAFLRGESALDEAEGKACLNGRVAGDLFEACNSLREPGSGCSLGGGLAVVFPLAWAGRRRRRASRAGRRKAREARG